MLLRPPVTSVSTPLQLVPVIILLLFVPVMIPLPAPSPCLFKQCVCLLHLPARFLAHVSPPPCRYIRYARSIKPQLSHEAAEKLVRMYKELRSDDAAPGTQSAYRITVRQLEALVRLSEAMARVYCQDVIKPNHVEEVRRRCGTGADTKF